jgi:transcriptional regulator GlxA family with amidase domain
MNTGLSANVSSVPSLPPSGLMSMEAGRLLEDVRLALDYDLGAATKAAGRLATLLANISPQITHSTPSRGGLAPWQKRKVEAYVASRLEGSILVQELAAIVSLSANHFSRAFKTSFGESPHAYITRARIARARNLMLTTPDSLSQIALACGFADQAHLCRVFRPATGTTPGAWRRSLATGT